MMEMTKLEKTT